MFLPSPFQGLSGAGLPVGYAPRAACSLWFILSHFQFGDTKSVSLCVSLRLDRVILGTILLKFVYLPSLQLCLDFLDK